MTHGKLSAGNRNKGVEPPQRNPRLITFPSGVNLISNR